MHTVRAIVTDSKNRSLRCSADETIAAAFAGRSYHGCVIMPSRMNGHALFEMPEDDDGELNEGDAEFEHDQPDEWRDYNDE